MLNGYNRIKRKYMKVEVIHEGQSEQKPYQTDALEIGRFILDQFTSAGHKLPEREIGLSLVHLGRGYSAEEIENYVLSKSQDIDITVLFAAGAKDYRLGLDIASVMRKYGFVVTANELSRIQRIKAVIRGDIRPHGIVGLINPAFANELNLKKFRR